jgi:hypothetical protein
MERWYFLEFALFVGAALFLFTFTAAPATYMADLVQEDANAPDLTYPALWGAGLLALVLTCSRKRRRAVVTIIGLTLVMSARSGAQVSGVQLVTGTPEVIQAGRGTPILVALPIRNAGSVNAMNVEIRAQCCGRPRPQARVHFRLVLER